MVTPAEFDAWLTARGLTVVQPKDQLLLRALDFLTAIGITDTSDNVKTAQMMAAVEIDKGGDLLSGAAEPQLSDAEAGSAKVSWFESKAATDWRKRYPVIYGLLKPYLSSSVNFMVVRNG